MTNVRESIKADIIKEHEQNAQKVVEQSKKIQSLLTLLQKKLPRFIRAIEDAGDDISAIKDILPGLRKDIKFDLLSVLSESIDELKECCYDVPTPFSHERIEDMIDGRLAESV